MKTIVITGSTRGIGYGLADSFLARGCRVVVSGRSQTAVDEAVAKLSATHPAERIFGYPCDVTECDQVQALWDGAREHFDPIDIWINNAGVAHPMQDFWEQPPDQVRAVVDTNVVGAMFGARVAVRGFLRQGHGSLYNMEGLGSDGRKLAGMMVYGTSKYALSYLTDALVEETQGTPVLVGALQPGMVLTDLITKQYEERPEDFEDAKGVLNILTDRVETVTPWLADKVLANEKTGARFRWLTRGKLMGRFLVAPFRPRTIYD
jgi:NAD(P)-dependent dehydrogenase (short-subunit alcohol dehydrogenase family)